MIFKCDKAALQTACQICARASASKSPITALEGLLLEVKGRKVQITGYDLRKGIFTQVDADIEEPGKTVVNARLLCEMIRRMPDGIISFMTDSNYNINIKCGRTQFNIKGIDASDYPYIRVLFLRWMEKTSHWYLLTVTDLQRGPSRSAAEKWTAAVL